AETEDRIAAGRRYYNANVRNYNTRIESIPSNFIAGAFHFEKAAYFEVNDPAVRATPDVSFGEISYRGGASSQPQLNQQASTPPVQQPPAQYQAPSYEQAPVKQPQPPQQPPAPPTPGDGPYQPPTYGQS
ncbi:MAG: LemA family protein, partial [Propioniciclava sp.]